MEDQEFLKECLESIFNDDKQIVQQSNPKKNEFLDNSDNNNNAAKQKKRRIRSTQQQVQNKLAQQRYRERRKQKYNEMENLVDNLQAKLNTLQDTENLVADLKKQNHQLVTQVQQQQHQLNRLQNLVKQYSFNAKSCNQQIQESDQLQNELKSSVSAIRGIMEKYNLLAGQDTRNLEDAVNPSISEEDLQNLGEMMSRSLQSQLKLYQHDSQYLGCTKNTAQSKPMLNCFSQHVQNYRVYVSVPFVLESNALQGKQG
eukprot:TRINITY_DN8950_c1_g3_i2.p2 TRINITY_DN8950_c1_g3~~TRINITY_DN8950_c1_g3_i2.p2  ORF type:complete len:257 (-),score=26.40 TRINITY_DN8950_c1_g3_i2:343-1113(-)